MVIRSPCYPAFTKHQGRERDCKIIPQVKDGAPGEYQHLRDPHQVLSTPGQKQLNSQEDGQQRGKKPELGYSLQ